MMMRTIPIVLGGTLLLSVAGCVGLAESIATRIVDHDLRVEHDLQVIRGDLALFRQCFHQRGGQCAGSAPTPLLFSANAADGGGTGPVGASGPGSSAELARSVSALGADHPAAAAHAVLTHPVVRKVAALHDHLRGVGTPAATPGVTVTDESDEGNGAGASTVGIDLPLHEVTGFHDDLLGTSTSGGWRALDRHCRAQLSAAAAAGADGEKPAALVRDCRTAAFVRSYLEAYFRQGEFVEVEVGLSGVITRIDRESGAIEKQLRDLVTDLKQLESRLQDATDFSQLAADVRSLETRGDTTASALDRLAARVAELFGEVLEREVDVASKLARPVRVVTGGSERQQVAEAVAGLGKEIDYLEARLDELDKRVETLHQEAIAKIDGAIRDADSKLSNVFKVSPIGFISRDTTFRAHLPTFDITFDPTAGRLFTVVDEATGKRVTSATDLADLGVAEDTSGVGTTSSAIGTELVRVLLEAIFDAHEGLPAIAPLNRGLAGSQATAPTGLSVEPAAYALPAFRAPMGNVSAADVTAMTKVNAEAAANVRTILQRVIGGIGPFSLNNQALEDFIVEIVATTVRKVAEKATWCFYSCDLDQALEKAERDAKAAIEAEAKKVEDDAKAALARRADEVRLKLRLHR